jgi:hypothetical protein
LEEKALFLIDVVTLARETSASETQTRITLVVNSRRAVSVWEKMNGIRRAGLLLLVVPR